MFRCSAAGDLINDWTDEVVPNINKDKAYEIRNKIFDKLFKVNNSIKAKQSNNI